MNPTKLSLRNQFQKVKLTHRQLFNFWAKVQKSKSANGCWIWTGGKTRQGYGRFEAFNKTIAAHKLSWVLGGNPFPVNLQVHHNCPGGDNPSCVNPKHLWTGTQKENMADMVAKERDNYPHGDRINTAKISNDEAIELKRLYSLGRLNQRAAAKKFGVHFTTINKLVRRRTWKKVT